MSVFVLLLLLLLLLQSPLSHLFYQWSKPQLQQTCSNCSLNRFQFQLFSKFRTKFHLKLAEAGCWLGPGTAEWRWLQWKHQNVPETDNNMKLVWIYGTMGYKYQISILCWREGGLGWWLLAQFNILVISEFMKSILISVRTFRYLGWQDKSRQRFYLNCCYVFCFGRLFYIYIIWLNYKNKTLIMLQKNKSN